MHTQHEDKPGVQKIFYRKRLKSLALILVLLLGLGSLFTITFAGRVFHGLRSDTPTFHDRQPLTSYPRMSSTPFPLGVATPRPSPSPTGPLPPTLSQAIATLEAQNRLLYGGNAHLPEIALTFDDGPHPYYTPQILAVLNQYHVQATFFCVGYLVKAYPALVQREYQAGHDIGNHSWSHPDLALLSPAALRGQLVRTSNVIEATTGIRPTLFRPPYGILSVEVLTQVYHLGLTTIMWNDEALDWQMPGANVISQRIFQHARDGAIILLHDGGGDRSQTVAALPSIIQGLRQSGFQLVTMQQLIRDMHKAGRGATSNLSSVSSPGVGLASPILHVRLLSLLSAKDTEASYTSEDFAPMPASIRNRRYRQRWLYRGPRSGSTAG